MSHQWQPVIQNEERKSVHELRGLFDNAGKGDAPLLPKGLDRKRLSSVSLDWVTKGGRAAVHSADARFTVRPKPGVSFPPSSQHPISSHGPGSQAPAAKADAQRGLVNARIKSLEAALGDAKAELATLAGAPQRAVETARRGGGGEGGSGPSEEHVEDHRLLEREGQADDENERRGGEGRDLEKMRERCAELERRVEEAEARASAAEEKCDAVGIQLVAAKTKITNLEDELAKALAANDENLAPRKTRKGAQPLNDITRHHHHRHHHDGAVVSTAPQVAMVVTVKKWDDDEVRRLREEMDALRLAHTSTSAKLKNANAQMERLTSQAEEVERKWDQMRFARRSPL